MQLTISALTKQTSIYGFFQLAQKAVAFAVIPLYTHYLTPSEYGTLDILYLVVWFIGIIGGSKLDAAFIRYYASANTTNTVSDLVSSSISGIIIFASVFCALAALGAEPILALMYSSKDLPLTGFYLALAATWLELVGSLPLAYLRTRQEAKLVGSISLLQFLGGTLLAVYCVTVLDLSYQGVLIGAVGSGLILVTVSYWALLNRVPLTLNRSYALTLFKYALPMLPAPLFMYLLNYADRFFLLRYWSLEEVGIYAMAYKFAMLIYIVIMGPFGEMWGANQFALFEAGQKQTYKKIALLYVSVLYLAALCINYFSYEVTLIAFDQAYNRLLTVVAPLTVGIAIWGIVPTLDFGCQIRNKTWIRSFATGIAALVNIVLNVILIPPLGMLGAALATLLAFVVLAWITYLFNRSLTDYYVDLRKVIFLSVMLIALSSLVYIRSYVPYTVFTIIRVGAITAFIYVLLYINHMRLSDPLSFLAEKPSEQQSL